MRKANRTKPALLPPEKDNQLDLSVIAVNWNTRELLRDCLKSVYEQAGNVNFEVIVIDNASVDDSCNMVRGLFPKVTLIANDTNKGYAAALNQGMRVARGRYFLLLNSDTVVCDSAIEKTIKYADEHPQVGVVGCQVWRSSDKVQMTCFSFPSVLTLLFDALALNRVFYRSHFFGRKGMRWWLRDSERQVDVVSGVFMLVRREAIDEVGLMDEDYFFLCEETDWCYRFSKAGWKMMFWPGASIVHVGGGMQSRKKAAAKMMVQTQKSLLIFFKKHYSLVEYLAARLILTVHCGLRSATWCLLWLCKRLMGKNTTHEVEKTRGFWRSLKFCILGSEPNTEVQRTVRVRFGSLKETVELVAALFYWIFLLLRHRPRRRVVIYYHALKPRDVQTFEKQMAYLAKSCCVVKASEIMRAPVDGFRPIVGVTFDDALASFCDNALPILQRYGLPATVFVPTGNLGKRPTWAVEKDCFDDDEIVIDEESVTELDKLGCEVLSHTVSHPHLTDIDDVGLETELEESKRTLETIVGHNVLGISYPYGDYDERTRRVAEMKGYQVGFSVEPYSVDSSPDNFRIGRFRVSPTDGMLKFRLKAGGAYEVLKYLRAIKRTLTWA